MKRTKVWSAALIALALVLALSACGGGGGGNSAPPSENSPAAESKPAPTPTPEQVIPSEPLDTLITEGSQSEEMSLEIVPDELPPAIVSVLMPEAPGEVEIGNSAVSVDASNAADGYIMVRYLGESTARLKVRVTIPAGTNYDYNLNTAGEYEVFPISGGSGAYGIGVFQNVSGNSYSVVHQTSYSVELKDEFAPFILPNQYVNYSEDTIVVGIAAELTNGLTDLFEIVETLYLWVVENYEYDVELAQTVQSGYLPDLDVVYEKKAGICFDYAATLTAMLRSIDVPTKLVVGYAGTAYHAWISVYSETEGWIESVVHFDGAKWGLLDPTFRSSAGSTEALKQYLGSGSEYSPKYLY